MLIFQLFSIIFCIGKRKYFLNISPIYERFFILISAQIFIIFHQKQAKMAKIALLSDLDKFSPVRKFRSRHDLNMVWKSFENAGSIVAEKITFMKFLHYFVTKTVLFRLGKNRKSDKTVLVTKRYKKV